MMCYDAAGGMNDSLPLDYESSASDFVNSFADAFGEDLQTGKAGKFTPEERIVMYADEGIKMAWMHGVQAAMTEKRATHWRRVLDWSDGNQPCIKCIEDSRVIHPISEPFIILHNNEKCTAESVHIAFGHGEGSTQFGVRGITRNAVSDIVRELIKYAPVTDHVATK